MALILPNKYGLGLLESPKDDRDYILELAAPTEPLPLVYSSYEKTGPLPILNQGKTPHCVAYGTAAMKMWQEKIDEKRMLSFDTLWFYKQCKLIDGHPFTQGTTIRAAMTVLKNKGIPLSNRFGLGAANHKIAAYYSVPINVHDMKLAIQQYGPIVTGIKWFNSWFYPVYGILPKPDTLAGGHGTEYYGWDDRVKTPVGYGGFLSQNSWSEKWGIGGIYIVPYAYVAYITEVFKAIDILNDGEPIPHLTPTHPVNISGPGV